MQIYWFIEATTEGTNKIRRRVFLKAATIDAVSLPTIETQKKQKKERRKIEHGCVSKNLHHEK